MQSFFDSISNTLDAIPDFIVGIIYIGIAFLLAWLVKVLIVKLLNKVGFDKKFASVKKSDEAKNDNGANAVDIIGKLAFLIIFVLFIPAILEKFGLERVMAPVVDLINAFVGYIPNVVACVLILWIGFFIASIVRQLIVAAISITKLDKLQSKMRNGKEGGVNISKLVGTVVYVIIAAVVLICALNVLDIAAISNPATNMLNTIINSVPLIIVALIVLMLGVFLGNLTGSFLTSVLGSFGIDDKCNNWLSSGENKAVKPINFSKIVTSIVKAIIIVLFAVEAINVLDFAILTGVGATIISFLPALLVAVIFLLLAYVLCRIVDAKVNFEGAPCVKKIIKTAIVIVAAFIVLSQLGIAPVIVNTAFVVAIIACGVAFAIAFGLGGREFAKNVLSNVKCCKKDKKDE